MFRDRIKFRVRSGNGGKGGVHFGLQKRPTGGNGGTGGSVIFIGDESIYDYTKFKPDVLYEAEDGEPGTSNQKTGADGKDLILRVPLASNIFDSDGNLIVTIEKNNQEFKYLEGGRGGLGNYFYRKGKGYALYRHTPGNPGETKNIKLELELESDIIFIGLPNAGKSSLLTELTNADAKAAAYAFTTTIPQLGRMDEVILMDLPGLIEDTHLGKGVGTGFLKHTRRAKAIAHIVSLEDDPIAKYKIIRQELLQISMELSEKPEIIILTKTDLFDDKKEIEKYIKQFKKLNSNVIAISILDDKSLESLKPELKKLVI